jgi:hypothetical protein
MRFEELQLHLAPLAKYQNPVIADGVVRFFDRLVVKRNGGFLLLFEIKVLAREAFDLLKKYRI